MRTVMMFRSILSAAAVALIFAGTAQAADQSGVDKRGDQETYTDTAEADGAGFKILTFDSNKETGVAAVIGREFVPDFAKKLPPPEPGWTYSMEDLDGDGGPELFLRIMHWTLCEAGCPVHVYRFDLYERKWKELFVANSSLMGIRPPRKQGERPEVAVLSDGPEGRGPTTTTFYRWERNDKFVKVDKGSDTGKRRKGK